MNQLSLDPIFLPTGNIDAVSPNLLSGDINPTELRHTLDGLPFNTVYDFLRSAALALVNDNRTDEAISLIRNFDSVVTRMGEESGQLLNIHAALMQILTALYIHANLIQEALVTAATVLNLLSQSPKRKDEPFLSILASLLYDISFIHSSRDENKQAEREIEKSMKLFERLARQNPDRYGAAHLLALNASTSVYKSRVKQANALTHYQAATSTYMQMLNEGMEDAGMRLIESLATEGRTLVKMNRQREAVQYFTRALKYLTKISPEFDLLQLQLSIDLGNALLAVKGTREKGIHLLNTMLYKSSKINADDEHRRIVDILVAAKNPTLDIFTFWHKLFPRS
ncbi:MAG: hypothetical protein NC338_07810 [Firmicutes bacterium]|nr:hypothetical protein [Bacillota bacterium]MCM1400948.1 hypothetical protein [Bacteroides sp.]MCM1476299.1 hypothetical protein [Bacteroides sp.]